jgi:hypothetical protein
MCYEWLHFEVLMFRHSKCWSNTSGVVKRRTDTSSMKPALYIQVNTLNCSHFKVQSTAH